MYLFSWEWLHFFFMCELKLIGFIFAHYLSRIFNQTEIDIINNRITLGYILSKVTNLRVEGQLDSNGNRVDINNADIQADPFVHRGAGKFDLMLKNLLNPPPPLAHIEVNGWGYSWTSSV